MAKRVGTSITFMSLELDPFSPILYVPAVPFRLGAVENESIEIVDPFAVRSLCTFRFPKHEIGQARRGFATRTTNDFRS